MIKKNGCTCKINSCNGTTIAEVDCEKGAPTKRYLPKLPTPAPSEPETDSDTIELGMQREVSGT